MTTVGPPREELRAELLDGSDLADVATEWRALAERRGNAFITPEWSRAWFEAVPDSRRIIAVVRAEDKELRGVVPLAAHGRLARFPGAELGDEFHPASMSEDEDGVVKATAKAVSEAGFSGRVRFDHAPRGAAWPAAAAETLGRPLRTLGHSTLPYADIAGLDWDGYLSRLSKSFRKRVRYLERAVPRDHASEILRATSAEALPGLLDAFFTLHEARWGSESSIGTRAARGFHHRFAAAALERGWLRLMVLVVDGEPASAFYGWRVGSCFCFYQSGNDTSASKHSLGIYLVASAVRDAIEEGAASFELLRGDEPYKLRFASASREAETSVIPARGFDRALSWAEMRAHSFRRRRDG